MSISNVAYFYGTVEETYFDKIKDELKEEKVAYFTLSQMCSIEIDNFSHLLVSGTLKEIKEVLELALRYDKSVGIVPLVEQKELMKTFELSSKLKESTAQALVKHEEKIDVLFSNNEIVLQEVVVGDAPPLDKFDTSLKEKSFFERMKLFLHTMLKVKELHHSKIKLTDAKNNEIKFSAVGLVGLEYSNATFASKLISKKMNALDGKLSLVILAPISILQYMGYLFNSLVSKWTPDRLPKSVGFIRSSSIRIESQRLLNVLIDSDLKQQTPIELKTQERVLALSVGEKFWEKQSQETNGKDSVQIDHLPSDDESAVYLSKSIPLFSHASQEQYAALFANLREESRTSSTFMVLLILATMIATFGLFINSSSVIIGAMLLAPLMQPIVSLSMGVLRQDSDLQLSGVKTIFIGVLTVVLTSSMIAFFTPIEQLTSEMSGRLSPTILDLFVAIVSGAAAAYAKSNEKILGSLAGVAIAVALVPPIAVAGIGLGWADWHMFLTAFLLFITNLVGIVLAASLTFVILGFSPLHVAKKGLLIWLAIVIVVSIPLYSSFEKMRENVRIQKILSNLEFNVGENDIKLMHIELIQRKNIDEVHCEVVTTGRLKKEEKLHLKEVIQKTVSKKVEVVVTFSYRL
ncbi:MAG: DUF389 domain-containing protein [Campylobacterota bacterium]|nr:DUF389 domain-containing protein [Campylobacterota bacterium]